jgi:LysM repeat protein
MNCHIVLRALALLALIGIVSACKPPQKGLDAENELNPHFRKAAKAVAEDNYPGAIQHYEAALAANPNVAKAHVEIGLLYSEKLGDPISGIYHFQRYLAARPTATDRDQVLAYIEKSKIDFALTLPNSTVHNAEEIARIARENLDLKQELAKAQGLLAKREDSVAASRVSPPVEPVPAPSPPPGAVPSAPSAPTPAAVPVPAPTVTAPPVAVPVTVPSTAPRTHTVQKGDSLWKIASLFYPDNVSAGVAKIKEANPEATANVQNLKLGTTLVIP